MATKKKTTKKMAKAEPQQPPVEEKGARKKDSAKKPPAGPPVPAGQKAFEQHKDPRQPPREENVKTERPRPGRFHPARGDVGGRG